MNTSKIWIAGIAAFFGSVILDGCKDENIGVVGQCPVVVSTSPANGATNVGLDKVILITFNEPLNPASISPASFSLVDAGGTGARVTTFADVYGQIAYDAPTYTISYKPKAKLKPNMAYTATVNATVKDLTGNTLQVAYIWTFTTGTSNSPTVIATDPAEGATNVFVNKKITATFSTAMNAGSINTSSFLLKSPTAPVTGTVSYTGTTAVFTPTSSLTSNTLYTATITTGAKDAGGVTLLNDFVWKFTTGIVSAPSVTSTDPANQANGVALNKVIGVNFSEAMNPLTINNSTFTLMTGTTSVAGTVNYVGTSATFTPTANLQSGNTYTATITTNAKNLVGTSIANDYVWSFNTNAPLGPVGMDLKSVSAFGIIAGVGVSNNAGFSQIRNLDVGISPGVRSSITGFPPAIIVNGAMYASDDSAPAGVAAMLTQAKQDLTNAYLFAEAATSPAPVTVSGDQGGTTLAPGIYKSTSTLLIQAGNLTLDGQGDVNATWIFQIPSGFTTIGGAGGNVILINGAQANNVYWQTGSSATIGNNTSFKGNILALSSITMNSGATADGRMLARNGSVVMTNTNIINKP